MAKTFEIRASLRRLLQYLDSALVERSSPTITYCLRGARRLSFTIMITDEIKDLMQADPFRPIRIVLGKGQSYVVAHTDYLMVSPDRQTVALYDKDGHFRVLN